MKDSMVLGKVREMAKSGLSILCFRRSLAGGKRGLQLWLACFGHVSEAAEKEPIEVFSCDRVLSKRCGVMHLANRCILSCKDQR